MADPRSWVEDLVDLKTAIDDINTGLSLSVKAGTKYTSLVYFRDEKNAPGGEDKSVAKSLLDLGKWSVGKGELYHYNNVLVPFEKDGNVWNLYIDLLTEVHRLKTREIKEGQDYRKRFDDVIAEIEGIFRKYVPNFNENTFQKVKDKLILQIELNDSNNYKATEKTANSLKNPKQFLLNLADEKDETLRYQSSRSSSSSSSSATVSSTSTTQFGADKQTAVKRGIINLLKSDKFEKEFDKNSPKNPLKYIYDQCKERMSGLNQNSSEFKILENFCKEVDKTDDKDPTIIYSFLKNSESAEVIIGRSGQKSHHGQDFKQGNAVIAAYTQFITSIDNMINTLSKGTDKNKGHLTNEQSKIDNAKRLIVAETIEKNINLFPSPSPRKNQNQ